ncbi:MAG: hypothetical protein L3K26_16935, partial [Candidatus Hydrogenedentes bacterium]|nr:hypothetical protein [Candidatus Hydrogenedentota bacterium]
MSGRRHAFCHVNVTGCLILCLLFAGCATANSDSTAAAQARAPQPLTFAATGDGPRGKEDWTLLPEYFAAEKADGRARYLLHTGDLCKGSQLFDDKYSTAVAALYRQSSMPVFFVVGDNEWNDQEDPEAAWTLWERDFMHFFEAYPEAPKVARQTGQPDNIAWMDEGGLFMGI